MTARKTPTDHLPIAAEALSEAIEFDYKGVTYSIRPASEWPFEVLEAFEDGKVAALLRALLGADQYAAFKATKPTMADAGELVEALQRAAGILGE